MVNYQSATMSDEQSNPSKKNYEHSLSWFHVKVFYLRLDNSRINESIPDRLTVNYIPFSRDTVLKVNGKKSSIHLDYCPCFLRRDILNKNSEEATFVSTDSIATNGSVKYEVYNGNNMILVGVLKLSNVNDFSDDSKVYKKNWGMECKALISSGNGFLARKHYANTDKKTSIVEVYVAGNFQGKPIVLTKTIQHCSLKPNRKKNELVSIPENETTKFMNKEECTEVSQLSKDEGLSSYVDSELDYDSLYSEAGEVYGELSWFNAGVRVGVGIGLGICLGVGIAAGMIVTTYQATGRRFKKRLL